MQNLKAFTGSLKGFLMEVKWEHTANVKKVAAAGMNALIDNTPIDTSEARSNWRTSVNSPNTGQAEFQSGKYGSTASAAFSIVRTEFAVNTARLKFGDSVYLRNNAGHIEELEGGKSDQAPGGILDPTIQAMDMEMKS